MKPIIFEGYICTHEDGAFHNKPCNEIGHQKTITPLEGLPSDKKIRITVEILK